MEKLAKDTNTPFPPTEYWHDVINPKGIQYGVDERIKYSLNKDVKKALLEAFDNQAGI